MALRPGRPAVLSDHGLEHALRALAQRAAVPVELDTALPAERLPMALEAAAYFAVSEALTNVGRYAQASHASVSVHERDGRLDVTVADDGVGGADPSAGSGLQGLCDRVAALNGTLVIDSRPGNGTLVRATPLPRGLCERRLIDRVVRCREAGMLMRAGHQHRRLAPSSSRWVIPLTHQDARM